MNVRIIGSLSTRGLTLPVSCRISANHIGIARSRSTYRRRRLGAVAATVFAACVAGSLYASSGASAGAPPELHVVSSGESLWSVVSEHYPPSKDPRVIVEQVREANDLGGYVIQPGDKLELPAAD